MQLAGVLHNPRVIVGGNATLDAATDLVGRARTSLTAEVFKFDDPPLVNMVRRRLADHVPVRFLADGQYFLEKGGKRQSVSELVAAGVRYLTHGDSATKIHSKSLVANGDDAIISTVPFSNDSRHTDDIGILFGGDAARAVELLTQSAFSQKRGVIRRAAKAAAEHGIYINDPRFGVHLLRKAMNGLIDGASERIVLQTKEFSDVASARRLIAARQHGVDVSVTATRVSKRVRRMLKQADIALVKRNVHANVMIADNQAYVGSAYLQKRPMARNSAQRQSREMGVVLSGHDALSALERTIGRGYAEIA